VKVNNAEEEGALRRLTNRRRRCPTQLLWPVSASGIGLGVSPPPCKMPLNPHCETDWPRIRGWIVRKFLYFGRFYGQNM